MYIIGKKRRRQKTVDYSHIVMEDGVMSRETVSRNTLAEAMARHDAYVRRAQAGFPGENRDLPSVWDSRVLIDRRMTARKTGFIYSATKYSIRVTGAGFFGVGKVLAEKTLPSGLSNAKSAYDTMTRNPYRFALPTSSWSQQVTAKLVRQDPRTGETIVDSRVL